ncbi:hypothetical protein NV226_01120 [Mycoplasma iguanae]|uniref:Uncharacterized protein n=1 Tax=Mycoplasma iguanae TaxID=292461 RepID=A0ABY5RA73_9MOLU|nr:hypothetical protein [Mycoplasma iguanae]UVD81890.1 hypothetical protein NV226_01120 [Mycoplasma iguanae]
MKKVSKTILGAMSIISASTLAVALIQQSNQTNFVVPQTFAAVETTANGKYFFRPSAITLDSTKFSQWNKNKYATQVNAEDIRKLFSFIRTSYNSNENATTNISGYKFEQISENGTITSVQSSNFSSSYAGFQLGSLQNSSINNLVVEITKADNFKGEIEFKVYQNITAYTTDENNNVILSRPGSTASDFGNLRALITPPTEFKSETDADVWKLPKSTLPLNIVKWKFQWAPDEQIDSFIKNTTKDVNSITNSDISSNFFSLSLDYNTTEQEIPDESMIPTPTISLTPNTALNLLTVSINLSNSFSNANKSFSKTFYGFRTNEESLIELKMVTNENLLNADIAMPYWDQDQTADPTKSKIGQKVSTLLPSEFVNPQARYDVSFLDIFNGVIKNAVGIVGTKSNSALSINSTNNRIGFLTYQNAEINSNQLAKINTSIKSVETFPDDLEGTLELKITYQTINNSGKVMDGPIEIVKYTGFSRNLESGELVYFNWSNTIPSRYASLVASGIVNVFRETVNSADGSSSTPIAGGWSTSEQSKDFVSLFFDSSDFLKKVYKLPYVNPSLANLANETATGSMVRITDASIENNGEIIQRIRVEIQFSRLNGQDNVVFSKTYVTSTTAQDIPESLQSKIRINQEFTKSLHQYSNLLPSELTIEQIRKMFILETPTAGADFTTPLDQAIIFAVPDDKNGRLAVSLIFDKFNNIPSFEYGRVFTGFKENLALKLNLELKHTPLTNLSANFLSKNPMDEKSLTKKDILEAMFGGLESTLFKMISEDNLEITDRSPTSVTAQIKINWADLTLKFQQVPLTLSTTSAILRTNDTNIDLNTNDVTTLSFTITGFTGGTNFNQHNDTPIKPGEILSQQQILWLWLGLGSSLFGILAILILWILINATRFNKKTKSLRQQNQKFEHEEE